MLLVQAVCVDSVTDAEVGSSISTEAIKKPSKKTIGKATSRKRAKGNTKTQSQKAKSDSLPELVYVELRDTIVDDDKVVEVLDYVIPKPAAIIEPDSTDDPVALGLVEQRPMFPNGDVAMMKFVADNIVYPVSALEEGVQGKVIVSFIIEKNGALSDVKVVRGMHPGLDKEAVRVVKKMPNWTPGYNKGRPVRVTYLLPVTFKF